MKAFPLLLAVVCSPCLISPLQAKEIHDENFGFRCVVPSGFKEIDSQSKEPNTLYRYFDRKPTPERPAMVFQLQRLRGVIAPGMKVNLDEIEGLEGTNPSVRQITWLDREVDITRQQIPVATGEDFVVFSIQYPLAQESVQLQLGGPVSKEITIWKSFKETAGSFQNTAPLYVEGTLSPATSFRRMAVGALLLALIGGVAVMLVRIFRRAGNKKKALG